MGRNGLLFAALAATVVAGCAAPNTQSQSAAAPEDRVYRTGSHLPSREPAPAKSDQLGAKADMQTDAIRRGQGPVPSN